MKIIFFIHLLSKVTLNSTHWELYCNINTSPVPSTHLLGWNLIRYLRRDQFETLETFPVCVQKEGTFCTMVLLLVRFGTTMRSWFSQLNIFYLSGSNSITVACQQLCRGWNRNRSLPLDCYWSISLLLINEVKQWLETLLCWIVYRESQIWIL